MLPWLCWQSDTVITFVPGLMYIKDCRQSLSLGLCHAMANANTVVCVAGVPHLGKDRGKLKSFLCGRLSLGARFRFSFVLVLRATGGAEGRDMMARLLTVWLYIEAEGESERQRTRDKHTKKKEDRGKALIQHAHHIDAHIRHNFAVQTQ